MSIAVMIIALCLIAIVGLQSCAVMFGGHLSQNEGVRGSGAAGIDLHFTGYRNTAAICA